MTQWSLPSFPPLESPCMLRNPGFRRALIVLAMLPSACSATLYVSLNGKPARQPAEVFECVKQQIPGLGYAQASVDAEAYRVRALKYDWESRSADTQFRRRVDRLSIEVQGASAAPTVLKIEAHTFAEYVTQRGPTEVEESASAGVKAAAHSLLEACGS